MALTTSVDTHNHYEKACRLGKKEGGSPAVLDAILKEQNISAPKEIPLGLVNIPSELLAGTKTAARSNSFSRNFYPLLKSDTEFAAKWQRLCLAHLEEGIRDPIKAYEFMNRFYVEEGNKRVSVLKYFDAVSIPANVIRIVPPRTGEKENRIYYEFMDFYSLSEINYIYFSQEGSFARLQQLVGKLPDEVWTDDDKLMFSSIYSRFVTEYRANGGDRLNILPGDAFLSFISLFDYDALKRMSASEVKEKIVKSREEFRLLQTDNSTELQIDPADTSKKTPILKRLIPLSSPIQQVAFIHSKDSASSGWTYSHELGRMHLQQAFADQISTTCYNHATTDNAEEILRRAIEDGNDLIFTTSPLLLKASLKAAIDHPKVKILNCSLNTSHRYIRTYYARIYESKFLMGALAGALAENDKIGYLADYPIYGTPANINAFALGAKMINPRAQIYLRWSCIKDADNDAFFAAHDIPYISGRDMIVPGTANRQFGLYHTAENRPWNLAMPVWNWGRFYEQMIRNIMNGSWKYDDASDTSKGLNYWWGLSAGMADVVCSHHLPIGTIRLIDLLKDTLCRGDFNPFSGALYSQKGLVRRETEAPMTPEEIIAMDWLAENVIGSFPKFDELKTSTQKLVTLQGMDYLQGGVKQL